MLMSLSGKMIPVINKFIGMAVVYIILCGYIFTNFQGNACLNTILFSPFLACFSLKYFKGKDEKPIPVFYIIPFLALLLFWVLSKTPFLYPRGGFVDSVGHFYISKMIYPSFLGPQKVVFTAYAPGYHILVDFLSVFFNLSLVQTLFAVALFLNVLNGVLLFLILDRLKISHRSISLVIAVCFPLSYYNIDALFKCGFYSQILGIFLLLFFVLNTLDYHKKPSAMAFAVLLLCALALAISYPLYFPCCFAMLIFYVVKQKQIRHLLFTGVFLLLSVAGLYFCKLLSQYKSALLWNIPRNGDCIHTGLFFFSNSFMQPDALFQLSIGATLVSGILGGLLLWWDKKAVPVLFLFLFVSIQVITIFMLHQLNFISVYYFNKMFYLLPIFTYGFLTYSIDKIKWGASFKFAMTCLLLMPVIFMSVCSFKQSFLKTAVVSDDEVYAGNLIKKMFGDKKILYLTDNKFHAVWMALLIDDSPGKKLLYADFESTYLSFYNHVKYINIEKTHAILRFFERPDKDLIIYVQDMDHLPEAVRKRLVVICNIGHIKLCRMEN